MKIVVLAKHVPAPDDGMNLDPAIGFLEREAEELVPDEIDERALSVAMAYKDAHRDTEVVVLSMGPAGVAKGLRKGLQCGADAAFHITDPELAGADALQTATALASALKRISFDLVITGNASTDGHCGVLPAMISEILGLPLLGAVHSLEISQESVSGERDEGHRRSLLHAPTPAVISVTERSAEPRFPTFKGIIAAKRKPVTSLSLADLADVPGPCSTLLTVTQRPERTAGLKIFDEGDAGTQLAAFLASSGLI